MSPLAESPSPPAAGLRTLGAVAYLNSRPLTAALEGSPRLRLRHAVPAELAGLLDRGSVELAMVPVVDLWRAGDRWQRVSDCCIASEAETLTVRVFSRVPPDRLTRLHCDPDSHTSVMLARVLWRELYGRALELVPLAAPGGSAVCAGVAAPADSRGASPADARQASPADSIGASPGDARIASPPNAKSASSADGDAVLLIGDKVVTAAPRGCGFEVDLGGAWRHLTGLPFVFAVWAGRSGRDWSAEAAELEAARDAGVARAAELAERHAPAHGWPIDLARRYLCETLSYRLTDRHLAGMRRFAELAGLVPPAVS